MSVYVDYINKKIAALKEEIASYEKLRGLAIYVDGQSASAIHRSPTAPRVGEPVRKRKPTRDNAGMSALRNRIMTMLTQHSDLGTRSADIISYLKTEYDYSGPRFPQQVYSQLSLLIKEGKLERGEDNKEYRLSHAEENAA